MWSGCRVRHRRRPASAGIGLLPGALRSLPRAFEQDPEAREEKHEPEPERGYDRVPGADEGTAVQPGIDQVAGAGQAAHEQSALAPAEFPSAAHLHAYGVASLRLRSGLRTDPGLV